MAQKTSRLLIGLSLGAGVALVLSAAFYLGVFKSWQDKLADKLFLKRQPSDQILIVAIDDASLRAIGQWPWPRAVHGQALEYLAQGKPRAVGYDVIFSEPSSRGVKDDAVLVSALGQLKVILPIEGESLTLRKNQMPLAKQLIVPLPIFSDQAAALGHVNVLADEDGVVRRLPNFIESLTGEAQPALAEVLAGLANSSLLTDNLKSGANLRINFAGPPGTFQTISFVDVYQKRVLPETFKDKIILVGVTSPDLHDDQITPFSLGQRMAGVEIHANALDTILSGLFLRDASALDVVGFIFLLSLAIGLIFGLVRRIWLAAALSFLVWLAYLIAALVVFGQAGLILNLVYPSLAFIFSLLAVLIYYYFSESRAKRYLRRSFQMYLEPSVIEEIIKDPAKLKLGGQKKT